MTVSGVVTPDRLGLVGTQIGGRFQIQAVVAEGGFGIVYRAHQTALDRTVAVKVLKVPEGLSPGDRAQFEASFIDEARTVARLRHPHIVEVHDSGVEQRPGRTSVLWMALEWLEGRTLQAVLEARAGQSGMSPAETLGLMKPVLEAIAMAHGQGVAHRDLKPGNLMVTEARGQPFVKVLDFGIAKLMPAQASPAGGRTSRVVPAFSPAYAAPEQITYQRTGPWTDVHALGLILTELLTNQPPYRGALDEGYAQALSEPRPTPASKGVDVGTWERVLARALALRPVDRYSDAGRLLEALEADAPASRRSAASTGQRRRATATTLTRPAPGAGGWRWVMFGGAGAVLVAVGLGLWAMMSRQGALPPAPQAAVAPAQPQITPIEQPASPMPERSSAGPSHAPGPAARKPLSARRQAERSNAKTGRAPIAGVLLISSTPAGARVSVGNTSNVIGVTTRDLSLRYPVPDLRVSYAVRFDWPGDQDEIVNTPTSGGIKNEDGTPARTVLGIQLSASKNTP